MEWGDFNVFRFLVGLSQVLLLWNQLSDLGIVGCVNSSGMEWHDKFCGNFLPLSQVYNVDIRLLVVDRRGYRKVRRKKGGTYCTTKRSRKRVVQSEYRGEGKIESCRG